MFDDGSFRSVAWGGPPWSGPAGPGDDRLPPRGLPPDAPLAMPPQVLERGGRGWRRWLGLLGPRPASDPRAA